MECKKCKETGILNHANHKEFWYCRTCKVEIFEEKEETKSSSDEAMEAFRYLLSTDKRLSIPPNADTSGKEKACGEIALPEGYAFDIPKFTSFSDDTELDVIQLNNLPDDTL